MTQRRGAHRARLNGRILAAFTLLTITAGTLTACGAPEATTGADSTAGLEPVKPSAPIALTILDGGGDLAGGGQAAIDEFVASNPDLVSEVTYQTAAATDVAGKIKAQQTGGSVDISLVLGGPDVLGAGMSQDLYLPQLPAYESSLPNLTEIQDDGRQQMQATADGYGVLISYDPSGPLLAYNSSVVTEAPKDPQELLDWAAANPGKFTYAQPATSGSGRSFMMSLPYLLGDTDPSDPEKGWDKTWAYLEELGSHVSSYPASSTILAQQFGAGQADLIPTIIAHDISNRTSGTWPADSGIATFTDQTWITDGHYSMIPAGVSPETLYVSLALQSYMLEPAAQEHRLLTGVLTTGNQNSTIDTAGTEVQDFIGQWGRPDFYPEAISGGTYHAPLTPDALQKAFELWQRNIGSKVGS